MTVIVVSGLETGTVADILQGTRLQTVPSSGFLSFELQASDNVAANNYTASIQMPSGATPLNGVLVPSGETAGLAGVLNELNAMKLRFRIAQGGHCVFGVVETGDAEVFWRVTYNS